MFTNSELIVVMWHIPATFFILIPLVVQIYWVFGVLYKDVMEQIKGGRFLKHTKDEQPITVNLITPKVV